MSEALLWWQTAAIYQIYPRSFQDSNGDGIGDLEGVRRRLPYLQELGVGAFWLSPFYPSPQADFGYDVADYCNVDPQFGTLDDFDRLAAEAHERGLKVIVDLVPNHTSDQHAWFKAACEGLDSPYRDWYVWQDPAPHGGPPNNWQSFFGGPAWTLHKPTGQYYLHHFLPQQPDLNYRNPKVTEAMMDVLRFWFRRGVDGFRIDVLWMLVEDVFLRSEPLNPLWQPGMSDRARTIHCYTDDQPETHWIAREMRKVADAFPERVLIGEIYLPYDQLMRYYGTPDKPEVHMPFNFRLISDGVPHWTAGHIRQIVEAYEAALPPGAWPNWVLGNHDRPRLATVLSANARLATMLLLTLRGTPTWYYGDELGMLDGTIPRDRIQDPAGLRQPHLPAEGRDPERTPMQWDASPYGGFSTVEPWLPAQDFATRNVEAQRQDAASHFNLTRRLLRLRQEPGLLTGAYRTLPTEDPVYSYRRGDDYGVCLNFGAEERTVQLPVTATPVLSTCMDDHHTTGRRFTLRPHEGLLWHATE